MKIYKRLLALCLVVLLLFSASFDPTIAMGRNTIQGMYHLPRFTKDHVIVYMTGQVEFNTSFWENKLIIDIQDSTFEGGYQTMQINSTRISTIRCSQFEPDTVRVVIDLIGDRTYEVLPSGNSILINIYDKSKAPNPTTTGTPGTAPTSPSPSTEPGRGDGDRVDFTIAHAAALNSETLEISAGNYESVNVFRKTDPDVIVMDIKGLSIGADKNAMNINSPLISKVSYQQLSADTVRVEAALKGQHEYSYDKGEGLLKLKLSKTGLNTKRIKYHNFADRVYIELDGVTLGYMPDEGDLNKYYTEYYDELKSDTYITYPSWRGELGTGKLTINDDLLNSISVSQTNGTTTISIDGKERVVTEVFPRREISDTAINILRPAAAGEKLVVIDAGHGGYDPGASRGTTYEKTLNLDICLRLNKLLKDEGIKTYMIREDDRFVGVAERAFIANRLKASLFVSVHNNSWTDRSYRGSMTLCYSYGSKSYNVAKIVQREILESLGTRDCGISIRPELGVLRRTLMPAVLAEIAFLSNDSDLANLQTEAFRQKAAQGLCNAIVEALEKVVK